MTAKRVLNLIKQGEGIHLEFKESQTSLSSTFFETVCAFLNREGGTILLGVRDNGTISGIDRNSLSNVKSNVVNLSNNPQKLNPTHILFPIEIVINSKTVLAVQVPQSSQIHRCNGEYYDRSNDSDLKLTNPNQIEELYIRKRTFFSESQILQNIKYENFKETLFEKVYNLIRKNSPAHPWLELDNEQMLRRAGLWRLDYLNNKEGYTLASILLFGKDEVIQDVLPHYKIDALVRINNADRYDDRLQIRSNLIEAYNLLMDFVSRHLPESFHMEEDIRVNLRDRIFREVVANLLVHREYTNSHQTSFTIYKDKVDIKNANIPHGEGPISLEDFTPYPKNPIISKFFQQLGRVEEIGSGIINVNKYIKYYAPGTLPEFIEGDIFTTIVPYPGTLKVSVSDGIVVGDLVAAAATNAVIGAVIAAVDDAINDAVIDAVSDAVKDRLKRQIIYIIEKKGINMKILRDTFTIQRATAQRDMKILKDIAFVKFDGPPKYGKYVLTDKAKKILKL